MADAGQISTPLERSGDLEPEFAPNLHLRKRPTIACPFREPSSAHPVISQETRQLVKQKILDAMDINLIKRLDKAHFVLDGIA